MWYHSISIQGRRPYNEDEYKVINNLNSNDITLHKVGYFGLFDGHGGGKISKFCKENVFSRMLNNPSFAKSVVGLEGKFFGMLNLLDFKIPLIIRKLIVVLGVSKE